MKGTQNTLNDTETLLYIERELCSYEVNVIDIEWKAFNYLDYHDQEELRKWEYLNKLPRGMFGR